jgi:hypothetical protein
LRNQGRDPLLDWHQHAEIGFSYRLSDINCALGISQLARIEQIVGRRQELAEIYNRELANTADIIRPSLTNAAGRISWFVYPVRLAADFTAKDRDWICESLAAKGIGSGRYFAPLHQQPVLQAPFIKDVKGWGTREKRTVKRVDLKGWGGPVQASDSRSGVASDLPQTELVGDRDSGSLWHAGRIDPRAVAEDVEQVPLNSEPAGAAALVVHYDSFFHLQCGCVGDEHDFAVRENVAIGADSGLTCFPFGQHVSIIFTG